LEQLVLLAFVHGKEDVNVLVLLGSVLEIQTLKLTPDRYV
jgi:hypothetical protein